MVSTLATVPVGTGGQIRITTHVNTTVFVDEQGYYAAPVSGTAGQCAALPPLRITDTRAGSGEANAGATLATAGTLRVQVSGLDGVPATASTAVVNITAVDDPSAGFLQAYPNARPTSPQTSSVNYNGNSIHSANLPCPSGTSASSGCDITSNRDLVALDATGGFTIFANQGPVDVVVDVTGYFTGASTSTGQFFTPTGVSRLYDSRIGGNTLTPRQTLNLPIAGAGGANPVIPTGASAAVLSVAIDKTLPVNSSHPLNTGPGPGFLTVFPGPTGTTRPLASDANFAANSIVSAHVYATLGADGSVNIYNGSDAPVDVVVDAYGFFSNFTASPTPFHVAVSANLTSIPGDGHTTSAITATVTDANGVAVSGDIVAFTVTGTGCGTVSPTSATTNLSGNATTTYTAGTAAGSCTVTATEQTNHATGSATVTQTAAALTLTPSTQSVAAAPAATATITATALNSNGTPNPGFTVYATVTSGPDTGETQSCVTGFAGTCTLTFTNNGGTPPVTAGTAGTDQIAALLDTDGDSDGVAPDPDSDSSANTEPTATASITWTAGAAAGLSSSPGSEGGAYTNTTAHCAYETSGGHAQNCGSGEPVTQTVNSSFTGYVTVTDTNGNPVSGLPVTFQIASATPANNENTGSSTCNPEGISSNISACTFRTLTATTDSSGVAHVSWTDTVEGTDYYYAFPTGQSSLASNVSEASGGRSRSR